MDATHVGLYSECLLDMWAWDFDLGREMGSRFLQNGIVKNKLVALPFGIIQVN